MNALAWAGFGVVAVACLGVLLWLVVGREKGSQAKPKIERAEDERDAALDVAESRGAEPLRVSVLQRLLHKAGYRASAGRVRPTDRDARQ